MFKEEFISRLRAIFVSTAAHTHTHRLDELEKLQTKQRKRLLQGDTMQNMTHFIGRVAWTITVSHVYDQNWLNFDWNHFLMCVFEWIALQKRRNTKFSHKCVTTHNYTYEGFHYNFIHLNSGLIDTFPDGTKKIIQISLKHLLLGAEQEKKNLFEYVSSKFHSNFLCMFTQKKKKIEKNFCCCSFPPVWANYCFYYAIFIEHANKILFTYQWKKTQNFEMYNFFLSLSPI